MLFIGGYQDFFNGGVFMFDRVKSTYKAVEDRIMQSDYTPKVLGAVTGLSTFVLGSGIVASADDSATVVDGADVASQLSTALSSTVTETYAALIPLLGIVIGCNFAWKRVRRTVKA